MKHWHLEDRKPWPDVSESPKQASSFPQHTHTHSLSLSLSLSPIHLPYCKKRRRKKPRNEIKSTWHGFFQNRDARASVNRPCVECQHFSTLLFLFCKEFLVIAYWSLKLTLNRLFCSTEWKQVTRALCDLFSLFSEKLRWKTDPIFLPFPSLSVK